MDGVHVPVSRVVRDVARELADAGLASARAEAELICAHVSGVSRGALITADDLDPRGMARVRELMAARVGDRVPLQYLTGRACAWRVDLAVGPGVFIPRPETALVVEHLLASLPPATDPSAPGPVVVDLCAGSGTLALEIAHARPDARVHAVELHDAASEWLRRNAAERAELGDTPVEVHEGDATDPRLLPGLHGRVDAVVSNPPYIPLSAELPPEVGRHEPHTALFGGRDGLVVVEPLVTVAATLLAPGGTLAVEHDDTTSAAVAAVVSANGGFGTVERHTDLAGRPRFVTATRNDDDGDDDGDDAPAGEKGTAR